MNPGTFAFIEQTLKDYKSYDKHINKRIEELKYPVMQTDENIGGGKGNLPGNPTERLAITLADDLMLSNLRNIEKQVSIVLDECDPEAKKIINLYYMQAHTKYTWEGIEQQTNYSRSQCIRIRDRVFEKIARRLGMPI